MKAVALPQTLLVSDEKLAFLDIQCDGVGRVGLQLDRVGAGLRRSVDDLQRSIEGPVMVAGHLRDDERSRFSSYYSIGDAHGQFNLAGRCIGPA